MTPEQKELKVEAFRALLNDKSALAQFGHVDNFPTYIQRPVGEIGIRYWTSDTTFIRLAPPAEIPWHNPEGVTQEQLEPEKGWRFILKEENSGEATLAGKCQVMLSGGWSESSNWSGTADYKTYRTREPLPEKYQHLVPESEEARAMRLFADLKAPEGYDEPEYLGIGPVEIEEGYYYASLIRHRSDSQWCFSPNLNGLSEGGFYARARKLPTDQEKAEAALNAYNLERGERLVHRGKGWKPGRLCNFLFYNSKENVVYRKQNEWPLGGPVYYAEIIKEPEMVPFTQETWPVDALQVKSGRSQEPVYFAVATVSREGIRINDFSGNLIRWSDLLNGDWYYRTPSTTWTRAGKGVEK